MLIRPCHFRWVIALFRGLTPPLDPALAYILEGVLIERFFDELGTTQGATRPLKGVAVEKYNDMNTLQSKSQKITVMQHTVILQNSHALYGIFSTGCFPCLQHPINRLLAHHATRESSEVVPPVSNQIRVIMHADSQLLTYHQNLPRIGSHYCTRSVSLTTTFGLF